MGNRIYGCDDCLAVCPWNKFAAAARELRLAPREAAANPPLDELLRLDDGQFRARFRGSPIKRIGRDRFVRNALVAAGNSGETPYLHDVIALLSDAAPTVRAMAVWALHRLAGESALVHRLREEYINRESDRGVLAEWSAEFEQA
jgi:epoxyqueuosine reductase